MFLIGIALYTLIHSVSIESGIFFSFDITYESNNWNELGELTVNKFEILPPQIDLNKDLPLQDMGLYAVGLAGKNIALQVAKVRKKEPEKIAFLKEQNEEKIKEMIAAQASHAETQKKIEQETVQQKKFDAMAENISRNSRNLLLEIRKENHKKGNEQ